MDIEKLIEQLKSAAGGPEGIKMCHAAATALSTLQPENERLKSLLGESGQDLWSKENQRADRLEAENEKLRAELEQARESLDFARTKDAEIVRLGMELEQVKRENETLKHALQNWHEEV
jgi:predicted  nucleic acid-binding Zn-ribbon protein